MLHPLLPKLYLELHQQGIPLNRWNPGSEEVAFDKSTALKALLTLKRSSVVVVGGDVVSIVDGRLKYAHENWNISDRLEELSTNSVERSHEMAREYIEKYVDRDFKPLFVFVLAYLPQTDGS
jgi:Immunity protein 40